MSQQETVHTQVLGSGEAEDERVLPRWFTAACYLVFIPLSVIAMGSLAWSTVRQRVMVQAVRRIQGATGEPPPYNDPAVQGGVEELEVNALEGLGYLLVELSRDPAEDLRGARILALEKALKWEENSVRRQLLNELLENMFDAERAVREGYQLPSRYEGPLLELIEARNARGYSEYEQQKITEVLEWVAGGLQTPAVGPEYRRLVVLAEKYEKGKFRGRREIAACEELAQTWQDEGDPVLSGMAAKLKAMLEGKHTAMTDEERVRCGQYIERWENEYRASKTNVGTAAYELVQVAMQRGQTPDHPLIFQMVELLGFDQESVRESLGKAISELKESRFVFEYLSYFARRDFVNPVQAVATSRLTRAEHHAQLAAENERRRRECFELLVRLGLQYCAEPWDLGVRNPREVFRIYVVETFRELAKVEEFRARAEDALRRIRETAPQYFE